MEVEGRVVGKRTGLAIGASKLAIGLCPKCPGGPSGLPI